MKKENAIKLPIARNAEIKSDFADRDVTVYRKDVGIYVVGIEKMKDQTPLIAC